MPVDNKIGPNEWRYGGNQPNHEKAAKVLNHELKGLSAIMAADEKQFFKLPLLAIIDFKGFRFLATTESMDPGSIVYGSDGETIKNDPTVHSELLKISKKMNIRPHLIGSSPTEIAISGDVTVYKFNKDDYYLTNLAHVLPPENVKEDLLNDKFFIYVTE